MPSLDRWLGDALALRRGMSAQIKRLDDEVSSTRGALFKCEDESERLILEDQLAGLRDDLSVCHGALIHANRQYETGRKKGMWAAPG